MTKPLLLAKTDGYDPDLHAGRVGSSLVPAVVGVSPYTSTLEAYLRVRGELPPVPDNQYMRMGRILEPVVAKLFTEETGMRVRNPKAVYAHPKNKLYVASPDRLIVGKHAVLECKTGGDRQKGQWEDGKVPLWYEVQVMWQLMVMGLEEAYIAALLGGQEFIYRHIKYDPEIADYILKIVDKFMAMVEDGTPPEPVAQDTELIKAMHPRSEAISIVLPDDTSKMLADMHLLKAMRDDYTNRVSEIENRIKSRMGEAEVAYLPGEPEPVATWKSQVTRRIDSKRLKSELPEVYEQYSKETTSRVLRVKE
jgi:putative phage-type endonuclease